MTSIDAAHSDPEYLKRHVEMLKRRWGSRVGTWSWRFEKLYWWLRLQSVYVHIGIFNFKRNAQEIRRNLRLAMMSHARLVAHCRARITDVRELAAALSAFKLDILHAQMGHAQRELDEADELVTQLGVEPRLERLREFDARIERATTRLANLARMLPNRKIARDASSNAK